MAEQVKLNKTLPINIHEYDKNKNIKKLYICGYKLGGSVATVVASILAEKFRHTYLVSCFTFGAFKVGNKYFKEYFNRHVTCNYRIMVEGDTHWSNHWKHTKDNINITLLVKSLNLKVL
jgi:predicted lipase